MRNTMPHASRNIRLGLAFKLSALILLSAATVFFAAFSYNYSVSRRIVLHNVEANAGNLAQAATYQIREILARIEAAPTFAAFVLEDEVLNAERIEILAQNIVETNPDIFASAIAFEPGAFDAELVYFSPYAVRSGTEIQGTYLGNDAYQYHHMDWYRVPKQTNQAVWSDPYFDEGGGDIAMATYSVPFYRVVDGARRFTGVVTVDISLEWLRDIMDTVHIFESGYAFIISASGRFIYHPNISHVLRESIFSLAEARAIPEWRDAGRAMIAGERGFIPIPGIHLNRPAWLYYAPLPSANWSLGLVFPNDELFHDTRRLEYAIVAIGCAGFGVMFLLIVFFAVNITRPLSALSHRASEIAKGNLDVPLPPIRSRDEVGELSSAFEHMRRALKEYIHDLMETTAAKERIESELKIAHSIQMSFLPRAFPPFPEHQEFRLHAAIEPAKEVGGDLYDYFLIGDRQLFFTIGDVADKGVPAALFMAVTKTLMKGIALQRVDPATVLAAVNNELCQGNDASLFVTVFCGCLDISTGQLRYSSAGHNPPLLTQPGGDTAWLDLPPGLVLGIMPDNVYETRILQMQPGSRIIAYTDGVTEAMNKTQELYSAARLRDCVQKNAPLSPKDMVNGIMKSVHEFADGAVQSDDIAVLAAEYAAHPPRL